MLMDVEGRTAAAALAARDALADLARGADRDERHMARAAETAVFADALLGALHARFNELRTAAK